ncbi:hypothetical protein P6709_19490 [Jeotgalibacillus sp. ET6]|uniref:hypothetical protein n=1 Tax=Jeotgalibacillus sp. ET6 TaxID=3037260 RepID=UPI0024182107|nr:hypothetical protein [Jeotgalibacillus sp. ET6]MDG5473914.1 hypothetical protein [Jeotgalibacillus sp. ET6]
MPTKFLEREATLAARDLRTLSQKALVEKVQHLDKLGLIINDQLSIAMVSWNRYEEIVDLIEKQNDLISQLENYIEDTELAKMYDDRARKIEKGEVETFEFNSAKELFEMLD